MKGLYIITGEQGSGKSELIKAICVELKNKGISVSGIMADGMWENNQRSGFVIESILTGDNMVLCESKSHTGWLQFRRFWFNPKAFVAGNNWLDNAIRSKTEVIIVDEIGPLEMQGEGWANNLPGIFAQSQNRVVIITVRPSLTEKVIDTYNLHPLKIIDASEDKKLVISEIIKLIQ